MCWAKKEQITDSLLQKAIDEVSEGLIDADLGGGLIKKRVAKKGEGKRGRHRVPLAFKDKDRSLFIFGFSKNDRENLDDDEKELYKNLSKIYLGSSIRDLEGMCVKGLLLEVYYEKT
jgi:hypothetical protein